MLNKEKSRKFEDLEPAIEEILLKRGIINEAQKKLFLYPDYEKLSDPFYYSGMEKAVMRVLKAKEDKEKVCIYGDYDADGVTSSVLLKDILDQLNIENFCYIPDRNKEGYGINEKAVDYIKSQEATLAIAVDCGISSYQEVEYAKNKKLDIVILDHHHLPPDLPKAVAVVNPKLNKDINNSTDLAGVGVVFKFIQGLISKTDEIDNEKLKWLLDLVCIGTIADCVSLLGENRVLAKFGLVVLPQTKRVGLKQIFNVGRINIDENNLPSSHQVSFQLAPRINAAGRMDHANIAFELLSLKKEDEARARLLALELESQNQRRQKITKLIVDEVEKELTRVKDLPGIIISRAPHWEMGVIGLAAGKIADKYYRPTLLLKNEEGISRGSGRSVKEFDLIASLEKFSRLLERYGGHHQAAGLVIKDENFEEFSMLMKKEVAVALKDSVGKRTEIDAKISFGEINGKLIQELTLLEPFGNGNREPIFLSENIELVDKKLVGKDGHHLKLWLKDKKNPGMILEAIGFGLGSKYSNVSPSKEIKIVYNLEEDHWNGNSKIQLKLIDFNQ